MTAAEALQQSKQARNITLDEFTSMMDAATRGIEVSGPYSHGHGSKWALSGKLSQSSGGVFHLQALIDRITAVHITPTSYYFEDRNAVTIPPSFTATQLSGTWIVSPTGNWTTVSMQIIAGQERIDLGGSVTIERQPTGNHAVILINDDPIDSNFLYDLILTFS